MAMWSRGSAYELALIYSAPPVSGVISGLLGRRLLKLGRELIIAIVSVIVMATATGLMGVVSNPIIAWALALTRWFFMAMFGTAITTFIQLRWRRDALPGVFSTSRCGRVWETHRGLPSIALNVNDRAVGLHNRSPNNPNSSARITAIIGIRIIRKLTKEY